MGQRVYSVGDLRVDRYKYWVSTINGKEVRVPLYRAEVIHKPSGNFVLGLHGFQTESYFEKSIIIAIRALTGQKPLHMRFE